MAQIMNETPLVTNSLAEVYASDVLESTTARYASIRAAFRSRFGKDPSFFARSPGRVNIIGEHIDYAGFSVLPMAIARDVVIAVAENDDQAVPHTVTVANLSSKYPESTFQHDVKEYVKIDSSVLAWDMYFKCGYKGAFEEVMSSGKSLFVLVDGNVPAGAGVSSSSAFVCASALATIQSTRRTISKGQLAQTAIRSERYCGVQSGGMDQSISVMGNTGSALLIHFVPKLFVEPIKFPPSVPEIVFVIANTNVTSNKHETAPTNYNLRVVETRLAAALLSRFLELKHCATLREVQDRWVAKEISKGSLNEDVSGKEAEILGHLLQSVESAFKDGLYSREDVAAALGLNVSEMEAKYIGSIVIRCSGFDIKKRSRHVFSEARRVYQFRDVCSLKPPYSGNLLKDLGDLMNASQESCRVDFNCSCPELDDLTRICRESGAFGSRLTGAGWGGCTVSLVPENQVTQFISKVKESYYYKTVAGLKDDKNQDARIADWIFASKPSSGAAVLKNLF